MFEGNKETWNLKNEGNKETRNLKNKGNNGTRNQKNEGIKKHKTMFKLQNKTGR